MEHKHHAKSSLKFMSSEEILDELTEQFERVFAVFKWSSMEVGVGCGQSEGWGEFNPDYADDGSDEAFEISEAVLGF